MQTELFTWWLALCAVSVINMVAWTFSAVALLLRRGQLAPQVFAARRLLLALAAGYVAGCAFRSFLPRVDIPRMVLFDGWLSSIALGRSVATLAELCFAIQWVLLLRELARATGSTVPAFAARVILPLIVFAELCSWHAVITTCNLGHALENSIWALCGALLVASIVAAWPRCSETLRPLLSLWVLAGIAYVAFMVAVDVPMYLARWMSDEAAGRVYLSLGEGWADVIERRMVSLRWDDWKEDVPWLSLYFSLAVWLSVSFAHAPPLEKGVRPLLTEAPRGI